MKYKVGDKVRINSLDWYNQNKDKYGFVDFSTSVFVPGMSQFCGKIVTIKDVFEEEDDVVYCMEGIDYDWTNEMFEGLVEEEIIDIDDFQDDNEIIDVIDEYVHRLKNNECQINLPEGYQFTDENGNVINAQKIVLEKKKKEVTYPKTYEECCKVMGVNHTNDLDICEHCDYKTEITYYEDSLLEKIETLYRLIICRDAYWKIAGEEMGLGKPWEPNDADYVTGRYCIFVHRGNIICSTPAEDCPLTFPTEEMRDAFYENFKELINECKELL